MILHIGECSWNMFYIEFLNFNKGLKVKYFKCSSFLHFNVIKRSAHFSNDSNGINNIKYCFYICRKCGLIEHIVRLCFISIGRPLQKSTLIFHNMAVCKMSNKCCRGKVKTGRETMQMEIPGTL